MSAAICASDPCFGGRSGGVNPTSHADFAEIRQEVISFFRSRPAILTRTRVYLACAGLHFLLVLTVCLRDTFSTFAQSPTVFPPSLTTFWSDAETLAAALLGQGF